MEVNTNTCSKNTKKVLHKNCKCSECGQSPIEGIRYHCLVCQIYDLCPICEEKYGEKHGHQLLVLRRPHDLDKYKEYIFKKDETEDINKNEEEAKIDLSKCFSKCINLQKEYTTRNNNNFIPIELILKNIGDENWPTPCFFTCEEESDVKGDRIKLSKCSGKPGEEFNLKIKINLTNVKQSGTYKSIWRLKNEKGEVFGQKIEIIIKDIIVKDLNLKQEEKENKKKKEIKDFRDELESNVKEIKQKYDILFSISSIRNALIRTKGNKENAIKILYTEQKMGKYHHF